MKKIVNALNNKVDRYGNTYFCDSKGTIELRLTKPKVTNFIGKITKEGDRYIYTKSETSSQKWGAKKRPPLEEHWSVGFEVLRLVDTVVFKVDGTFLHTLDVDGVREASKVRPFHRSTEQNNCEYKVYIPVRYWNITKL